MSGVRPTAETASDLVVWNVPNIISMARLGLSVAMFAMIHFHIFWPAFVLFIVAASTDWLDGWYARKYDQVTKLGRILDPFCDKVLICGAFVLLAEAMVEYPWYCRIAGWMAVVVIGRELLVTSIRGIVEQGGGDFSAKMHGKLKMWFQCFAVGAALLSLALLGVSPLVEGQSPSFVMWLAGGLSWLAAIITVYSGLQYVLQARPVLGF